MVLLHSFETGPREVGESPTSQRDPEIHEKTYPCFCPYKNILRFTVTRKNFLKAETRRVEN